MVILVNVLVALILLVVIFAIVPMEAASIIGERISKANYLKCLGIGLFGLIIRVGLLVGFGYLIFTMLEYYL